MEEDFLQHLFIVLIVRKMIAIECLVVEENYIINKGFA